LTGQIIECAIRVHEALGPGLLESVYRACVILELRGAGLTVDPARRVPLIYRGVSLDCVFCPDLVVNDLVIVELKSVQALAPVHSAQLITYLKLSGIPVGLLMNFNVPLLKQGIRRVERPDLYKKQSGSALLAPELPSAGGAGPSSQ